MSTRPPFRRLSKRRTGERGENSQHDAEQNPFDRIGCGPRLELDGGSGFNAASQSTARPRSLRLSDHTGRNKLAIMTYNSHRPCNRHFRF